MQSIDFPGAYVKIGAGQEEYHTIHAMPIDGPEGEMISIYRLTDEEVQQIVESKTLFYSRWTFHNQSKCIHCNQVTPVGFQPMRISTTPIPFKAALSFPDGSIVSAEAEVRADGVHVPGYEKTPDGQYIKSDEAKG